MQTIYRSGGVSGEFDLAAEVIEASDQALDRLGAIVTSEVIGTKVLCIRPDPCPCPCCGARMIVIEVFARL